jgi:hypothetical protein
MALNWWKQHEYWIDRVQYYAGQVLNPSWEFSIKHPHAYRAALGAAIEIVEQLDEEALNNLYRAYET